MAFTGQDHKIPAAGATWPLAVLIAIVISALPLSASPAQAQQSWAATPESSSADQLDSLWPRLSPKQQFTALEQLLHAGQFATAGRVLAASHYDFPGDRAIARFYSGIVARGDGREREAVAIFREVLAEHPEFTRVRLELAQTLFAINEDDSARHNFELVLGGAAANPGLQNTVRSYINAIDGRKHWDLTTFLTIAPSTNINQGSTAAPVLINGVPFTPDNVEKSGVGVYSGFQAGYRLPIGEGLDMVLAAGAQGKRYHERALNDTLVNASIGPKWRFDRGSLGLYATIDHRWSDDANYATTYGGLLSGSYAVTAADSISADLGYSLRRFDTDWHGADLSYQDGRVLSASGRFEHHFDSSSYLRVLGNVAQERTGFARLDSDSFGGGAGIYKEFPWGFSLYLQGMHTKSFFQGDYPVFGIPRADQRTDVSVHITKRDFEIFGFAPMLQYTYTHNDSNIPLTVYDAQGVALTLTNQF